MAIYLTDLLKTGKRVSIIYQNLFMKNFKLESSGLTELNTEEQQQVAGGIGLVLLAAFGGFMACYNLGKVVGEEAYHLTH